MESTSSIDKELVRHILLRIDDAITTLKERNATIHSGDDFAMSPSGMEKLDAACMLLIAIGESIKSLDKNTNKELLSTYPSIKWKEIMGVRDIIAHHYFDVDADVIFEIIDKDLDPLLTAIRYFEKII